VVDDHPSLPQAGAELLPKGEVGGAVAVQVADLVAADVEAPLPALSVAGPDTGPGGDDVGDPLAG